MRDFRSNARYENIIYFEITTEKDTCVSRAIAGICPENIKATFSIKIVFINFVKKQVIQFNAAQTFLHVQIFLASFNFEKNSIHSHYLFHKTHNRPTASESKNNKYHENLGR